MTVATISSKGWIVIPNELRKEIPSAGRRQGRAGGLWRGIVDCAGADRSRGGSGRLVEGRALLDPRTADRARRGTRS